MLVLKVSQNERVSLFLDGKEIGQLTFDRNHSCGPNSIRLILDFDQSVKILRNSVIDKNHDLKASLTFRKG